MNITTSGRRQMRRKALAAALAGASLVGGCGRSGSSPPSPLPAYPPPRPSAAPTWTTSPTPDYAAALPEGAGWAQDGVQYWHSDRSNGREYHFVAYSLDGKPGLAVVDVAASPPRREWSLADAGIEPLEERPAVIGDPSFGIAVAIAGEDGAELVVLEPADDSVSIAHHFFVPDPACHQASPRLARIDLSGDGLPERIILTADPLRAWFYPAAGRLASERAIRPVASLEGALQLLDADGDGGLDVLSQEAPERWRMHAWRDDRLEPIDSLSEDAAAEPLRVSEGSLPPMGHDLFFWRDGKVVRVPGEGGLAEEVYLGASDPPWGPVEAPKDVFTRLRPFALSRGARTLAIVERGCDTPKCSTTEYRFRVTDLATGTVRHVPWRVSEEDSEAGPSTADWDLSADGRWLVFLERPSPEAGAGGGTFVAVDLSVEPPERRTLASCEPFDAVNQGWVVPCRPWVAIAPDGAGAAVAEPTEMRLLSLAGGSGRTLWPNWFGESVAGIRMYRPEQWSPDGRRILASVGHYEGISRAVVDLPSESLWPIPDSVEYSGPSADYAWLPDGSAIVQAVANGVTGDWLLRLVDLPSGVRELLPARALGHGADLSALAPAIARDGTVLFVLRDWTGAAYQGNGLFAVDPDGGAWRRVAALPAASRSDNPDESVADTGVWAADASVLLLLPHDARYKPVGTGDPAFLIAGDGSEVIDVGPVVAGGGWFQFADP